MNLEKVVEEIGKQFGNAADKIIPYYVQWFIYSSAIQCTGSVILGVVSYIIFFKKKILLKLDSDYKNTNYILGAVFILLAFFIFLSNLEDLLAPTGIAYHQFIKDLTQIHK